MKVKLIGYGILVNENNERFSDDGYGNIMSLDNGNLYKVLKRNEKDEVIEIEET